MNLRVKLFILIGSLFILIAILSFYLPQLLLNQDMQKIRETFNALMVRHQEEDHAERRATFVNRIQEDTYLLNSDLYGINDSSNLRKSLNPSNHLNKLSLWQEAANFSFYNPEVGLIQISQGNQNSIALATDNGQIYNAEATPLSDRVVSIQTISTSNTKEYYLGVKIDIPPSENRINIADQFVLGELAGLIHPIYYYLYNWDNFFQLPISKININIPSKKYHTVSEQKMLAIQDRSWQSNVKKTPLPLHAILSSQNGKQFKNTFLSRDGIISLISGAQSLSVNPLVAYSVASIQKRFRIREEASLLRRDLIKTFLHNLKSDSPLSPDAPLGIAILAPSIINQDKPSTGYALLSKDLFFEAPLFNDHAYYLKNSAKGRLPVAVNVAVIDSKPLDNVYIGNTLSFHNTFERKSKQHSPQLNLITLATSLGPILEDLATSSELVVFLTDPQGIRLAFSANGTSIPPEYFNDFPINEMINGTASSVVIKGITYDFFKLQPVPSVNTYVLIIVPQSEEIFYQFKNTMLQEMLSVSQNISYQLLAVSLLCLGISLIVLGILSSQITKPIMLLAKATEDVSKGHYSEIYLPKIKNKNDEITVLSNSFADMVTGLRDREKIRGVLDKVVSKEIAEEILKGNIHLGGEEKIITMLFSDIRHFSKMTERLPPQIVIEFLNLYMTKMSNIIEKEGGVIDKYVGDEIMALYGAPIPTRNDAYRAIMTALKMVEILNQWNQERALKNLPQVEIGIGIHTGIVVAGNMGAENRLNYTVLGANVNLASRLCMAAAPMQILITETTLNELNVKNAFIVEELPDIYLKGFSEPIRTYSVKGLHLDFNQNTPNL